MERDERPIRGVFSSESLRYARRQSDIETVERQVQTFAASLDVAFLASPARVEAFVSLFGRKSAEFCEFTFGKETARDVLPVFDGADEFDVNAEAAFEREGEECDSARVRDIEVDGCIAGGWAECGFAALAVQKLDLVGRPVEVATEQFSQSGASRNVGITIAVECEAVGARVLIWRKDRVPSDRGKALRVMRKAPNVDFPMGEPQGLRGPPPLGLRWTWHAGIL
jgi:hypothetical protein